MKHVWRRFKLVLVGLRAVLCGTSGAAQAQIFNPADFASLGVLAGRSGSFTIDTDALTMSGPNGYSVQGVSRSGVAVFAFASMNIPAGATFRAVGSRPVMLLSQGNATVAGTFNLNGSTTINDFTKPAGAYMGGPGVGGSDPYNT